MSEASTFERVGVIAGCAFVAVFVVALLGQAAARNDAWTPFVVAVLVLGVAAGVVAATTGVLEYETVWAFALGAWLAAVPLVTYPGEARILLVLLFDTYLQNPAYRVFVLAVAGVGGAVTTQVYDRLA
jgi:hypothetical protein